MTTDVPTAREDALLSAAIGIMLKGGHKVLAVIEEGKRLVGIVDRADLLRGLVPESLS
jgi:CBS domain-containing protein